LCYGVIHTASTCLFFFFFGEEWFKLNDSVGCSTGSSLMRFFFLTLLLGDRTLFKGDNSISDFNITHNDSGIEDPLYSKHKKKKKTKHSHTYILYKDDFLLMVFISNISAISWRLVLLVEETRVLRVYIKKIIIMSLCY
jgi:hypothetical protein